MIKKLTNKMFKKSKAFTLIELLIVMAVIAILVGVALPRFKGMQDEGNVARAKGELRTLKTALESYYLHNNNTYPAAADFDDLINANPQIITTMPNDPFNGTNDYGYATSASGTYYVVYSVGSLGNGSATIADTGAVTETNDASCIYESNGTSVDSKP